MKKTFLIRIIIKKETKKQPESEDTDRTGRESPQKDTKYSYCNINDHKETQNDY